jgi:hypothetical protein
VFDEERDWANCRFLRLICTCLYFLSLCRSRLSKHIRRVNANG